MDYPKLIGLCGQAGAGKDLVAALLKMRGYTRYGFADRVRVEIHIASTKEKLPPELAINPLPGWDVLQQEGTGKIYEKPLHPQVRQLLQWWGTEYRRAQDRNYWIKELAEEMDNDGAGYPESLAVISDVRFQNEADWITQAGGKIWKVHRPNLARDSHVSENEFTGIREDFFIKNSGDLQHLASQVIEALEASRG